MNKIFHITALLICIISFYACVEDGIDVEKTGTIEGSVLDAEFDTPLAEVSVSTSPITSTVLTDEEGNFLIENIAVGSYALRFELEEYVTRSANVLVTEDEVVEVNVQMNADDRFNEEPTLPTLISPPLAVVLEGIDPLTLTWQSTDPDNDAITYDLRIYSEDITMDELVLSASEDTSYVFDRLQYGTTYFWQVIASDGINQEVFGEVWYFQTPPTPLHPFYFVRRDESGSLQIQSSDLTTEIQITDDGASRWRPRMDYSKNRIAYISSDDLAIHLFTADIDGTDQRRITTIPLAGIFPQELDFCWEPTDQGLIYPNFNNLYRINRDGSATQIIYSVATSRVINKCEISENDGSLVIVESNLQGHDGNIIRLTPDGTPIDTIFSSAKGRIGGVDFSASGNEVLFTFDVSEVQNSAGRKLDERIFEYNLTTGIISDLSDLKSQGFNDTDPRYSPNNGKIIFTNRPTTNQGPGQVMTMDRDGSNRVVLFGQGYMTDWN